MSYLSDISDEMLFGDPSKGRGTCARCGWDEDSAMCRACECYAMNEGEEAQCRRVCAALTEEARRRGRRGKFKFRVIEGGLS